MKTLEISHQPVELYKILKLDGQVSSGGSAKAEIAAGHVRVNGIVETRKRKQINSGDVVSYSGEQIRIQLRSDS